jgi:hypothetical protein
LDDLFTSIRFYLNSSVEKLKNKSLSTMTTLVHYHSSYREIMSETISKDVIGLIEDRIEQRNVRGFGKVQPATQADSQFFNDYEKERNAYLAYKVTE